MKILNSPAPSILAASSISWEKVALRYMRMKKTVKGVARAGMISINSLFIKPNLYVNWMKPSEATVVGIIMAIMIPFSNASLSFHLYAVSAYAVRAEK